MIANRLRVRQGGLLRCCLASLAMCEDEVDVGDVLDCRYEDPGNANLVLANDAVWEWNRP